VAWSNLYSRSLEPAGLPLGDIALAHLGRYADANGSLDTAGVDGFPGWDLGAPAPPADLVAEALLAPHPEDRPLVDLGRALSLTPTEILAAALAIRVETDATVGRILAWLQSPTGGARPTLGLLAAAFADLDPEVSPEVLAAGNAVASGLLVLTDQGAPLPERSIAMPVHLLLAARGRRAAVAGVRVGLVPREQMPLPPSLIAGAARHAQGLAASEGRALLIRTGHPVEGRAVAGAVARELGRTPLFIEVDEVPGLVPWLHLAGLIPVFVRRLAPSERMKLPALAGYEDPVIAVTGPDGSVEAPRGTALSWTIPIPGPDERVALWEDAVGDATLATSLAGVHRHGVGRIAELGRLACQHAAMEGRPTPTLSDVRAASWHGDGGGLAALAQPLNDEVPDEALILSDQLRRELELLLARCRQRERLVEGLGIGTATRYRTGVRALLVGPSGTGKTLAASWLATRLALPLYRVDMASVISKYIGETEKNLAELLARAEAAEVVLFFDEADTLFGKRTDVRHSTDRFANAQTNYLLQRIEAYDGVVVLASNSRSRFDPSFSRRLDVVLEFPLPGPEERKALWTIHLGDAHTLTTKQLNQLAARCDLAGGHVRNAVLAAAVLAREAGQPLSWADVVEGLRVEYRKLGKPLPPSLTRTAPAGP